MNDLNDKSYNTVLQETSDFFAAQGVSIIGEGYKEIATNPALFESYVENLTEGASADHAAAMAQLMSNTNSNILKESSMTGIQPIASLSMPVIRKLWPKFALKDALHTEVAKTPRFVVAYTKPYMVNSAGVRKDLAKGILSYDDNDPKNDTGNLSDALKKEYTEVKEQSLNSGAAAVIDFSTDPHVTLADGKTPSQIKKQPCDELVFVEVKLTPKSEAAEKVVKLGKRLGVDGSGLFDLGDGCQLVVKFDGANAKATVALVGGEAGAKVALKVKAGVSSEYNEESWSVGLDIARQDIDIPTGQHINAPLPIEALNDMMALYQIDGTKETVELMTNIFASKVDLEILDFIQRCLANRPGNEAYKEYGAAEKFVLEFDCKPAAGFAGSPKAWREEIKPMVDYLAQTIRNETYLTTGTFTIVGNPLDIQILANVDWSFRGGQGGNMDGVAVDYSVGTYVGANTYKVIASTLVPAGAMYLLFIPSGGTQLTYAYYPYTFSTEMGYVDPNRSRVPSIMMTKRHTMFEFMPAIGAIIVKNNNGQWFNKWSGTTTSASYAE